MCARRGDPLNQRRRTRRERTRRARAARAEARPEADPPPSRPLVVLTGPCRAGAPGRAAAAWPIPLSLACDEGAARLRG